MFISELFEHDTSDFTGSVRCTAPPGEQEFTGVAVEMDDMNGIFTTAAGGATGRRHELARGDGFGGINEGRTII